MNALEKTIYALVLETKDIIRRIDAIFQEDASDQPPTEPADNQSDND